MKYLILTITLLLSGFCNYASVDCLWTSRKAGITVQLVDECDFKGSQHRLDSIVNNMALRLNRVDTSEEILILVNHRNLFMDKHDQSFAAISYDALQPRNFDSVLNIYWKRTDNYTKLLRDEDLLDYTATGKMERGPVGLRIIYSLDFRKGPADWNDIMKLLQYAVANEETIKQKQKRIVVQYFANDWRMYLTTIDPAMLDSLLGWERRPPAPKLMEPGQKTVVFHDITISVPNFIEEDTVANIFPDIKRFYFEDNGGWMWLNLRVVPKDSLSQPVKELSTADYCKHRADAEVSELHGKEDCTLAGEALQLAKGTNGYMVTCSCQGMYIDGNTYTVFGSINANNRYYNFDFGVPMSSKSKYENVFRDMLNSVQLVSR